MNGVRLAEVFGHGPVLTRGEIELISLLLRTHGKERLDDEDVIGAGRVDIRELQEKLVAMYAKAP